MDGRFNRDNAPVAFDTDNQDTHDLECVVAVPGQVHPDSAHIGNVPDHAGTRILFLGIDDPDSGVRITGEQSNETFYLCLSIADEACSHLIV